MAYEGPVYHSREDGTAGAVMVARVGLLAPILGSSALGLEALLGYSAQSS